MSVDLIFGNFKLGIESMQNVSNIHARLKYLK